MVWKEAKKSNPTGPTAPSASTRPGPAPPCSCSPRGSAVASHPSAAAARRLSPDRSHTPTRSQSRPRREDHRRLLRTRRACASARQSARRCAPDPPAPCAAATHGQAARLSICAARVRADLSCRHRQRQRTSTRRARDGSRRWLRRRRASGARGVGARRTR